MSVDEYESLALRFNPGQYDPEEWAGLAKASGCRYAVLTAKHCDGYCLFDTSTTDYSAPKTGPRRDLVGPYVEAFRSAGLKVGFYFSLIDWHDPDFASLPVGRRMASPHPFSYDPERWNRFLVRVYKQVEELLTKYGRIDLMWFDAPEFRAERWHSHEMKTMMLNLQPHLVVNNRLPDVGDYVTPEQHVPLRPPEGWWETCMTMNRQWGYHPDPTLYKSPRRLIRTLAEVVGKGGNLLLNVGPRPDGTFPPEAVERLRIMGEWMRHSAEAIHQVEAGPYAGCFYGPMTRRGRTLYLHVFDPPLEGVEVRGVAAPVLAARLLRTGQALPVQVEQGLAPLIRIELDPTQCDPYDTVIALEFGQEPEWPI